MFNLENLIKNEYFPLELPPCFNTDILANYSKKLKGWVNSSNKKNSIPCTFSGFKNINGRRKFAIPNPYHYIKAIDCIVDNSSEIFKILNKSNISLSAPIQGKPKKDQPYCRKTDNLNETRKEIEKLYQDNLYEIKLDIGSFFDSIYTHSIPWAMHTMKIAKRSKGREGLIGDKIDYCMQSMNYSQTHGILVGNAISRIISEIILCTVDEKIQEKFKNIKCKRFVDDYYIYVKYPYEIQNIISFIRNELGKYDLLLNENKISITESPFSYGKSWVEDLKLYIHLDKQLFLNKTINLYNTYKDINIIKYGLKVISLHSFKDKEWITVQSKIINLWTRFPSVSDLVLRVFLSNKSKLKKNDIKNAIYTILERNIELNNHQEVIWAIWIAKILEIKISSGYLANVIKSKNPVAIILLLDIISKKEFINTKEITAAVREMLDFLEEEADVMWSQYWLLAYEIDFNCWAEQYERKFEFARKDEFFKRLIEKNINFYNNKLCYDEDYVNKVNTGYLTRAEFYEHLKKIKNLINDLGNINKEKLGKVVSEGKEIGNELPSVHEIQKQIELQRDRIMYGLYNFNGYY